MISFEFSMRYTVDKSVVSVNKFHYSSAHISVCSWAYQNFHFLCSKFIIAFGFFLCCFPPRPGISVDINCYQQSPRQMLLLQPEMRSLDPGLLVRSQTLKRKCTMLWCWPRVLDTEKKLPLLLQCHRRTNPMLLLCMLSL